MNYELGTMNCINIMLI